jgi:hypothetical protein
LILIYLCGWGHSSETLHDQFMICWLSVGGYINEDR